MHAQQSLVGAGVNVVSGAAVGSCADATERCVIIERTARTIHLSVIFKSCLVTVRDMIAPVSDLVS